MQRICGVFIVTLLLCTSSGCGTIFNVTGQEPWLMGAPPERPIDIFGGVDNDVRWMKRGMAPNSSASLAIVVGLIDMPFSFVGDIITLPWTAYQSLVVRRQTLEQSNSP